MITFLYGRPGSGKTQYITEMIRKAVSEGKRTYLLVPEQQVFISESMLADLPASAALCFEVVSFSRLCTAVFSEYGGLIDTVASTGARNLIMWQSLRTLSPYLSQYKDIKTDIALSSMMLSAIDELHASGITPEDCEKAGEDCEDEILSSKLRDIAAIYADFERVLSARLGEGAFAAENKLSRLITLLKNNDFFNGANVFVDSFTSFTGEEHAVLEEIALQADDFCISFCLDEDNKNFPHTKSIDDTLLRFKRFVKENTLSVDHVTLKTDADKRNPVAALLEDGLWNFSLRKESLPTFTQDELGYIEAFNCKSDFEEIDLAALKILQAYRNGVRFSEIAVIMRDAESRKGVIEAVFEKAGIPYFCSEKTDLSTTPAARLVFSALRCVIYNFRQEDVLTLIKTGLCGIDPLDADLFEDYCYTWNISGKKFCEEVWSMHPDGYTTDKLNERTRSILNAANRVRKALIPPLLRLKQGFSAAKRDTTENCRALYSYLREISLAKTLAELAEFDLASGDIRSAGESLRLYDYLISSITEICTTLSDTPTTPEELSCAIEIMLRNTDIGSVPAVGDCVTVGSASTLRVENVKVAIVLGLCEGEFPKAYSDSGVFTESDKALMEKLDIDLCSREDRVTSDELFYVYRAMTKPSQKLIISNCLSRVGGGSCTPSNAWNRVMFLFKDLKAYDFDLFLIKRIAEVLNEKGEDVVKVGDALPEFPDNQENPVEDNRCIHVDPMQVKMIFGDKIYLSQSKISDFASCPYKYWAKYVLDLREKKVGTVSYNNSGSIVHYVLEHYIRDNNTNGTLDKIEEGKIVELVNGYVDKYVREIGCDLPPSMMYSFSRLRDLALVMVKSVIDEFNDSSFRILAQELKISEERENALRPLEIRAGDDENAPKIILSGTIDRIDCYDGEDRTYLRVVDYKTGSHPFSVDKIGSGEDLQLPAYLFTAALEQNKGIIGSEKEIFPASALFLSANDSSGLITTERSGFILGEENLLRAASASMNKSILAGISIDSKSNAIKGNAAVSEERINEINTTLHEAVSNTGKSIYEGRVERTPSQTACKYCFMRSACPVACKCKSFN